MLHPSREPTQHRGKVWQCGLLPSCLTRCLQTCRSGGSSRHRTLTPSCCSRCAALRRAVLRCAAPHRTVMHVPRGDNPRHALHAAAGRCAGAAHQLPCAPTPATFPPPAHHARQQMGKFYELFEMDAHTAVETLGLSYMKVGWQWAGRHGLSQLAINRGCWARPS